MRVTVKRADRHARDALKAAIAKIPEVTLRISIYATAMTDADDAWVAGDVAVARDKLLAQHKLSNDLIEVAYLIRLQLAEANMQAGISEKLTRGVKLAAQETQKRALLKLMEDVTRESIPTVLAQAAALRSQSSERALYSGRADNVTLPIFREEDMMMIRRQLKQIVDERRTINDELTAANVSNYIELNDETLRVLRQADILPD